MGRFGVQGWREDSPATGNRVPRGPEAQRVPIGQATPKRVSSPWVRQEREEAGSRGLHGTGSVCPGIRPTRCRFLLESRYPRRCWVSHLCGRHLSDGDVRAGCENDCKKPGMFLVFSEW